MRGRQSNCNEGHASGVSMEAGDPEPGPASYPTALFESSVEKQWFWQFFVAILVCVNNGACFCFGIFSPYMKQGSFQYSQTQINTVSTIGVLLSYFSVPTGYLYDAYGPSVTLATGAALNVTGWAGMYIIFKDMENPIWGSGVAVMSIFYGLAQLSASFYETGSVLTNLKSFSCYQGRVILIQKTFMGLGSSIIAQLYVAFFELQTSGIAPFFLFQGLYSAVVGVLSFFFIRMPTAETRCLGLNVQDAVTRRRGGGEPRLFLRPFNVGTVILITSVVFILAASFVENFAKDLSIAARVSVGIVTILLSLSFIAMVVTTPSYLVNQGGYRAEEAENEAPEEPSSMMTEDVRCAVALGEDDDLQSGEGKPTVRKKVRFNLDPPAYGAFEAASGEEWAVRDVNTDDAVRLNAEDLWVNLHHCEVWLLWMVCFGAWGAMTLVSSNSSQIYLAIDYDNFSLTVNTVFVSLFGVASALGRVIVGAVHPHMERRRIRMTALLPVAPLLCAVGLVCFLAVPAALLFVPFVIVGLAVGVSWGSTVLIITSLFASHNCGKHYSFLYTAGMLSPLVFNSALFGPLYDHFGNLQGHGEDKTCAGVVCIAVPVLVCAALNCIAAPCGYLLHKRCVRRGGIVHSSTHLNM